MDTPPPRRKNRVSAADIDFDEFEPLVVSSPLMNTSRDRDMNKSLDSMSTSTLRQEAVDRQSLEKANFDLKMKVFYLEDTLRKFANGESAVSRSDEAQAEITNLQLQLEEKRIELEQRNVLLLKAKSAIEALKEEAEKLRNEGGDKEEVLMELKHRLATSSSSQEEEMVKLKDFYEKKIMKINEEHDEEVETLKNNHNFELQKVKLQIEKSTQLLIESETKSKEREETLLRKSDRSEEFQALITMLNAEKLRGDSMTQDLASVREELNTEAVITESLQHENQKLEALVHRQEKELLELRSLSSKLSSELSQLKERHVLLTESYDTSRNELKEVKEKEEIFKRTFASEKAEELQSFVKMLESERSRSDSLIRELADAKNELRGKIAMTENIQQENQSMKVTLRTGEKELNDMRVSHQKISVEMAQLRARFEQLSDAYETARDDLRERENILSLTDEESRRTLKEVELLREKARNLDEISKDYSRLKDINESLKQQLSVSQTQINEMQLKVTDCNCAEYRSQVRELENFLKAESVRSSSAEATLVEVRNSLSSVRAELTEEQSLRLLMENKAADYSHRLTGISRALSHLFESSIDWENKILYVLDEGDTALPFHANDREMNVDGLLERSFQSPQHLNGSNRYPSSALFLPAGEENMSAQKDRRGRRGIFEGFETTLDITNDNNVAHVSSDELFRRVSVQVERMNIRIQRMQKFRSSITTQVNKYIQWFQEKKRSSDDRISLLDHQLSNIQHQLMKTKSVIERDQKIREREGFDMRDFRDKINQEHTNRIREYEEKTNSLLFSLEQEKRRNGDLSQSVQQLNDDNSRLREEIDSYVQAESQVEQMSRRIDDIIESNHLLSLETEDRGRQLIEAAASVKLLSQELSELKSYKEEASRKIAASEVTMKWQEEKITTLSKEIEKLENRQIDPALERAMLHTQSIIQDSLESANNKAGSAAEFIQRKATGTTSPVHLSLQQSHNFGNRTDFEVLERLIDKLEGIYLDISGFIDRSNASAEHIMRSLKDKSNLYQYPGRSSYESRFNSDHYQEQQQMEAEIFDLLESNSRLTLQLHQTGSDWLNSMRKLKISVKSNLQSNSSRQAVQVRTAEDESFEAGPNEQKAFTKSKDSPVYTAANSSSNRDDIPNTHMHINEYRQLSSSQSFNISAEDDKHMLSRASSPHYAKVQSSAPVKFVDSSPPSTSSHFHHHNGYTVSHSNKPNSNLNSNSSKSPVVLLRDPMPLRRSSLRDGVSSNSLNASHSIRTANGLFSSSSPRSTTNISPHQHRSFNELSSVASTPNQVAAKSSMVRLGKIGADLEKMANKLDSMQRRDI